MKNKCTTTEEKETCSTHTKEKEKSGTCCQENVDQEKAEQQTYEYQPQTSGELVIDDTNDCEWCQ
jgi:hypothetical protein